MSTIPGLNINIDEYSYDLPVERIAKYPLLKRDDSRLILYKNGMISHTGFRQLPELLGETDLMVRNDTRVIQARIIFTKPTGANIEIFCLEPVQPSTYESSFAGNKTVSWKCLIGNAKKWRAGKLTRLIETGGKKIALIASKAERLNGDWIVQFNWEPAELSFGEILEETGKTPIPPYLNRESVPADKSNYQTIYSRYDGSVAAPTAGLHFTDEVLAKLQSKNIPRLDLTLHVGAGTFRPVMKESISKHNMHREHIYFSLSDLKKLREWSHDIVAVGTTMTRTLESIYWLGCKVKNKRNIHPDDLHLDQWEDRTLDPLDKEKSLTALIDFFVRHKIDRFESTTSLMIIPGYTFRMVNKLITNFHQPRSSLLLLVGAFIGDDWRNVYRYALDNGFRFLSYGDSSLLIPEDRTQKTGVRSGFGY